MSSLLYVCLFTFLIHMTECLVYGMRLAGVRTKQIAIAMSFVTSSLLVSRLSNMFQAPVLGHMVDNAIISESTAALSALQWDFRWVIFAGFVGSLMGFMLSPTLIKLYEKAIKHFLKTGSIPRLAFYALRPRNLKKIALSFELPNKAYFSGISLKGIPKQFLVINILVTSIYTIGVLCSLLAGANLPDERATAIQLSGIINGMATVLFTIFVDPSGARITDQAINGQRPESHVRSVVVFLQMGRLIGTLIVAQLFFLPFTEYIMWVTRLITQTFH